MKNILPTSKKHKNGLLALLVVFCGLFANNLAAQNMFWGNTTGDNNWATAANWSGTTRSAHSANFTTASNVITLTAVGVGGINGLPVTSGLAVVGPGIPPNTTITAVSGIAAINSTITLSNTPTGTGTASLVYIYAKSAAAPTGANAVFIENRLIGSPVISSAVVANSVAVRNTLGGDAGATLIVDSTVGAALTINSTAVNSITLAGGNIVNNGIINLTSTITGATSGISCATPSALPASATTFGYSGSGTLNINVSASTTANSAAINVSSLNANTTYSLLFNGTTSFNLGSTNTSYVVRHAGGALASPLIIGGTGFTHGSVGTPVNGGLLNVGQQSNVTVNALTTLTLNSASTNLTAGVLVGNSSTTATTFTNRGTINIYGSSARSGLQFNTFTQASAVPFNIANEGIIDVNLSCLTVGSAPLITGNGGGAGGSGTMVNINNTGTMSLKNNATAAGLGAPIFGLVAAEAPAVTITNNGTLNLEGSSYSYGNKFSIINNSILNSNSELRSFNAGTNSGIINFVRTAATATTRQVQFNGLTFASAAGLGATYSDGTNSYVVVNQKYTSTTTGTTLTANVLSSATVGTGSGTLTLSSGTGDANIAYTSVSVFATNNALTSTATNTGTINTDTVSNLNIVSGVSEASTGVIDPGGLSGRGIADFANANTLAINSTLRLQIAAGATAGVHFDQITNATSGGGFILTNAKLDVTSIYTPVADTTIDIITVGAGGTLSGNFSQIITTLPVGWDVIYTPGINGKVSLVYTVVVPGTIVSAGSGLWTDTATWVGGVVPTSSDNVIIGFNHAVTMSTAITRNAGTTTTVNAGCTLATNATYTNNGTTTINGSFQLNAGGWVSDAGGTNPLVYGAAGTLIFNAAYTANSGNYWPTTSGPANVTVNASSALNLGFARTVSGIFQTASGVTNANNLTANGSMQLNLGGFVSGSPTYGPSSTLIYNTGAIYGRGDEWTTAVSGAGYPANVRVGAGVNTTLNVVNGSAVYRRAAGNLIVSTGSTLLITDLNTGAGTVGLEFLGSINNDGTITLEGTTNSRLKAVNLNNGVAFTNGTSPAIVNLASNIGGDLELTGNYNDNATFNSNERAVFFTGAGATQTIGGNAPGPFNIDYIVVTRSAVGGVQLLKSMLIGAPVGGNGLTLTNAANDILDLNGSTLTLGTVAIASTISGNGLIRSTAGSLVVNGTGALGTLTFDGANNTLANLTINRTAGSVTLGSALNITTGLVLDSTSTLILGGALTVSRITGTSTVAGIIAGTGPLIKTGAGVLTLSAASGNNTANTYSGGTTISAASSGTINVTGLTNITSTAITQATQFVTFSTIAPANGTYQLLPGTLSVGTQSFSHNANATKIVTLDYSNSTITVASSVGSTISGATTTAPFTTIYGAVGTAQSFPVTGVSLTDNILVTPPLGFQVSADGITYADTVTFIQTSGSVSATLYVRLRATASAGLYNSLNIVLSSAGATSINIVTPASGNIVSARDLTITATDGSKSFGNTFPTGSGSVAFISSGLQNSETVGTVTISSTGAVSTAAVATYPIVPSGVTGGTFNALNYNIIYANGVLTVSNANTGDYRSVVSGNWSSLSTWERWSGTAWATPTTAVTEGYPGQYAVVSRVFINNNTTVTADVSIFGTNRPTRLELVPIANNAVLNINPGISLGIDGPAVLTSTGFGSTTGDSILNVGSGTLAVQTILSLNDTQGSTNTCELRIGTGAVTVGTQLRMLGAANENAIVFEGSGTLTTSGTAANAIGTGGSLVAGSGTVIFNGAAQTVGPYVFNNVTLSGSGVKTINATSIGGNLTIAGTAKARLTSNYTIPSLILLTAGQSADTYGSTISAAVVKNDTYFDNASGGTGILTVSSNLPFVTPTIGAYTYTGLPQGPIAATNSGSGSSYTFSYTNNGGTPYGPTPTVPTNAGNYFVTVTVAANGSWLANSSAATGFRIAPRGLTITANAQNKQFGNTLYTGSGITVFTTSGLQNSETVGSITIASTGAAAGAAVATYPIVPSAATGGTFVASNYAFTYTNGTLTVTAPAATDYRTVNSGDWTDLTIWEKWNGTAWVQPTALQGYPCETAPARIYILNSHNVTCGIGVSGANRATRIEINAGANNTSLTFNSINYFECNNADIVLTSTGAGNALLDVSNANIYSFGTLNIGKSTGGGVNTVIINNGLLNFGTNITMGGSAAETFIEFTGSGTLSSSGGTISGGTIIAGIGTVRYNKGGGAPLGDQTVGAYTYNNLILGGTSTKTLVAAMNVTRSLTIADTAIAGLPNGFNKTIPSLIYAGVGQTGAPTTYGSNNVGTVADVKTDTYFNSATTGIITVNSNLPYVNPNVPRSYTYTGVPQGVVPTNSGTGTSYTILYTNNGGSAYSSSIAPTDIGNYFVAVTVAADGVWLANSAPVAGYSIVARTLTITANSFTKQLGSTVLTGLGSNLFTASGLQNGQTIGSITFNSTGAVAGAAAGTYATVPTAATSGTFVASNYNIIYANGTLTVATPTTGNYRSKASGPWTTLSTWERWDGTAWVEPISTSPEGYPTQFASQSRIDILDGHAVTCSIGITGTNRPTRLEVAAGSSNTSLTFTSSNYFEINGNLVLTATGNGSAFVNVNAAYVGVTGSVSLGDTPSSATDCEAVITTGALFVFNSNSITMSGAADENAIRLGSGLLTCNGNITGGTIVAGTGTVQYGGAAQTVGAYNFYNLILAGTLTKTLNTNTVISESLTISGAAIASLATGSTYTINSLIYGTAGQTQGTYGSTTSVATNQDDTKFASTGILNIVLNTPDITVTVGTYTYTGLRQGPNSSLNTGSGTSYTYSYRSNGGTVYAVSADAPINAGNYFVTVMLAANGGNASRRLVDTPFTIATAPLTITANNDTKVVSTTYTTGAGSTAFTPTGLQNSETIGSVTIASTGAISSAALGTYPIVVSAAIGGTFIASNYTITYTDGTLTVVQNTGDYRSKDNGDWITLATWERWSGTAWVEPTIAQGYPCQNAAPVRVDILNGHAVTCGIGITGANRLTRLEVSAGANDTSLTFTSSAYFETVGNIIVTALGVGNATLNVGNASLVSAGGFLRMNNVVSPAPATSKVIINNGTLTSYGANLQMLGDAAKTIIEFTGAGLLRTAGVTTNALVGGSIIPGTGTVEFMGAGQTIGIYNFYNLTLSGSGTKTINALTTITSNVRIAGAAVASLSNTYNIDTLTLDCGGTVSGTWGSTTSGATNTNNTYFAATTGLLNVATNSTVNPLAVVSITAPTCTTLTGTITVTVQNVTDTYSFNNGTSYQTSNVLSGLPVNIYNVIIKHRSGCTSPTTVVTLNSASKTWNGSEDSNWNNAANWTPSGVPDDTNCITVPGGTDDLIVNGLNYTASLYSLTVENGVTMTVEPTNSLKVTDFINVDPNGTLTIQNTANLVQINSATNIGNIIYQRTPPTDVIETDYIYWSSPVAGLTLAGVSPSDYSGGTFYSFDSTIDNWTDIPFSTSMVPGLGYIMRGQKPHNNPFTVNATFTGVPNNGPINASTGLVGNSALLGNPYPSAIDADKFLAENSTKIEGTLYFWTHNTKVLNNVYTAGDYASYNGTGGTETLPATSGGGAPTGKIAACQGFFTTSLGAGDATFNNGMRLVSGIPLNNANFYKTKNSVTTIEKNRVWLNLTNTKGAFKQVLVGYVSNATNGYDSRFDGKTFDGNEYLDFYSINQNKNLTIQGRALPFDVNDEVPLGYRSTLLGEFSISIDHVDGLLTNQAIYLEDKLMNVVVNLKTSSYTFSTALGVFNDRFVLRFKDTTLGTNDLLAQSNKVLISVKNKEIKINSFRENLDKVTVYDLLGRQIYHKTKVSAKELMLSNFASSNQALLVKITLQNGITVTEKVIY